MLARPVATVQKCVRATGARSFFAKASEMPQITVDEEFPHLPKTSPQPAKQGQIATSVTSSGLKIASDNSESLVATLGVHLAAGSRVETDETAGLSQLFAKMAFRATAERSDLRLYRDIEAIGGVVNKAAGRDFVRYNISVLPEHLEAAAEILAETTLAPRFAQWDIAIQKEQVKFEADALAACSERSVYENVHAAAFYDDATVGRHVLTAENLDAFDSESLAKFYEQYVNTAGLALVGSGIEHSTLTGVANEFFGGLPVSSAPLNKVPAKYVGGESRVKKVARNTYVALGFETVGKASPQYGASHVLKSLLTSRLNHKNAAGFLASYNDVGLVGFRGFAAPAETGALVDSFVTELKKVASAAPSEQELAAAKNAAALEAWELRSQRNYNISYLGSLAHAQASAVTPLSVTDAVTAKAVQELAQKALASRPSLASVGKLSTVPRLDAVIAKLK
ncbi:hypothetical protein Poli38472_005787 [Pythium oligandrum]|uniref:Uncharacterized protein n=1 Tax=Pythium oligandrum TaxID=41045 RepID=A0A8K1CRM2_PYTOL|nr:hypothetical protein Poli38472_005787 [Pythium oligandrum]|eukprot:TMW68319.1 hypothetical protein Poli38472_005787 [Pythium oligandrum]